MKHTEFYDTIKSIRHHIVDEIKAAVKAHGGEYSWDDEGECPIVAANPYRCEPEPLDVCINSILLDSNDMIQFEATGKSSGYEVRDLDVDDIFVEHLGFILDYMGDTTTVLDVSIPFEK